MYQQIIKQARWWAYAAWTLPFVALALLVGFEYFNLDNLYDIIAITIIVVFFSVSVFWWWWAIDAIKKMFVLMKNTEENFNTVKETLKETKEILKNDLDNRQRRE